ncbi:hypothetical protein OG216_46790 (plasmid) [Streptomycetaceae bacterium NBC_01309]
MTAETIRTTAGPGAFVPGPARTILAAAQAAVRAAQERAAREARERDGRTAADAAEAAVFFVKQKLGAVAEPVQDADAWIGYPPLRPGEDCAVRISFTVTASAVAWLGAGAYPASGIWLHFEHRQRQTGASGCLTVVTRCVCGRHREREIGDMYGLADALDQAVAPAGDCDRACTAYQRDKDRSRACD